MLNVTRQGAACDAASVYFGSTIRRTDILVKKLVLKCLYISTFWTCISVMSMFVWGHVSVARLFFVRYEILSPKSFISE